MPINHGHAAIHAPDRIDAKVRESVVVGSLLVPNGGVVQSIASVLRSAFHSRRDDHSTLTCSPAAVLRGSPPLPPPPSPPQPPCSILAPCSVRDAGAELDAGAALHSASNAGSDLAPCSVCDAGAALDAGATLHSASNAGSDVCDVHPLPVRLDELPDG